VNDLERPIGTYLYGRRLYEVMTYWETAQNISGEPPVFRDYTAIWQAADKVVYSTSLASVTTARTRLERVFDPEVVGRMKQTSDRDISVGGPGLAGHALRAGLVDEYSVFVTPVVVGGGTAALPDRLRLKLDLVAENRFRSGVVHLRYSVQN
jgi:dihydrofolate reductase